MNLYLNRTIYLDNLISRVAIAEDIVTIEDFTILENI